MTIFIVSETLTTGGAEWFCLRLARALKAKGNDVYCFVLRPDIVNDKMKDLFQDLTIFSLPLFRIKLLVQLDRIVKKITGKYALVENANIRFLKKYIAKYAPDVVHGHLIESDLVAVKANDRAASRNVATVHGDYIGAIKENQRVREIRYLLKRLSGIAVITDEQQIILKNYYPACASKLVKIYNGYPMPDKIFVQPDDSVFYFGMVARAVVDKGWKPLIKAFSMIQDPNIRLILYGEGDYLDKLESENKDERIIFAGFTNDPLTAISKIHVGVLPSYCISESLPTTIIEYLAMEKPVVVTNVGEVKKMIEADNGESAGILIHELDKDKMVQPLHEAMITLLKNKELYLQKKRACKFAFEKFSMDQCIDSYLQLYKKH